MRSPARLTVLTVALFLWATIAPAEAGLVVSIGKQNIVEGGTGFVDVTIRSDNLVGDPLTGFGFEFVITPAGPRTLQFVDPQADLQLAQPDYVFFGNSADLIEGTPVGVVSSSGGGTNNRFVGGDDTDDVSDMTVMADRLLARLDLTAAQGVAPIAGDVFTITLLRSIFTSFDSNAGPIDFTTVPGQVMIIGSTVPEPSSLVLALLGSLFALQARRFGRRPE